MQNTVYAKYSSFQSIQAIYFMNSQNYYYLFFLEPATPTRWPSDIRCRHPVHFTQSTRYISCHKKYSLCKIQFMQNTVYVKYSLCKIQFITINQRNTFHVMQNIVYAKHSLCKTQFMQNTVYAKYSLCKIQFISINPSDIFHEFSELLLPVFFGTRNPYQVALGHQV